MVDTGYLLNPCMAKSDNDMKTTILRTPKPLHQKFQAAAKVEAMDMSNMIRQFMSQTVQRVKAQEPEAFEACLKEIKEKKEATEKKPDSVRIKIVKANAIDKQEPVKQNIGMRQVAITFNGLFYLIKIINKIGLFLTPHIPASIARL